MNIKFEEEDVINPTKVRMITSLEMAFNFSTELIPLIGQKES